jgi:hypothetical protein
MMAEPDDTPVEPSISPAASGKASDQSPRPRPTVIEQQPEAQPAGLLFALVRPLAAGLIGGLLGGGILALTLAGGGPKPDEQARLQIKDLQDKIREQQDKTAQLNDTFRVKLAEPVKAASPEELNDVRSRLDDISKATKAEDESVQSLAQKVEALEQKPTPEPEKEKEAIQAEIASQIASVTERLAGIERAQGEKASEVTERLAGLERTQSEKASEVTERMAGIERTQSERASDARTATVTIALKNLERAVNEGKPFATELSAIERLSSEKLPVSELASYKETGVPSLSQLQHEFTDTVRNVIVKHYHGKAESFVDEMLSRARGAIQVKPIGGAGDTVEALLGRMEKSLKAGDLSGALKESAALEGPAKEELQAWLKHAQARAAADEAVRKTDEDLLASLTKTSATH